MYSTPLIKSLYIEPLATGEALLDATYYPVSTKFFSVSRMEKFAFLIIVGATFDTETTIQLRQDVSATATAALKDVDGALITIPADVTPGSMFYMEVFANQLDINNGYQYVTLLVSGPSEGVGDDPELATLLFLALNSDHAPVTYHTSMQTPVVISD